MAVSSYHIRESGVRAGQPASLTLPCDDRGILVAPRRESRHGLAAVPVSVTPIGRRPQR